MSRLPLTGAGPSSGLDYGGKVLSYSPIAYWKLNETSGTTAVCSVNAAQNGTYSSAVNGWPVGTGIGDGNTAPGFDGTNDYVDVFSATLAGVFDGQEGSLSTWLKVYNSDIWPGGYRQAAHFHADWDNTLYLWKNNGVPTIVNNYTANTTGDVATTGDLTDLDWMHFVSTWSVSGNVIYIYKDGSEIDSAGSLGTWAETLTEALIGSRVAGPPVNPWYGWLAHYALFDYELQSADVADLAAV